MCLILYNRTDVRFMFDTEVETVAESFWHFAQSARVSECQSRKPLILQGFTGKKSSLALWHSTF